MDICKKDYSLVSEYDKEQVTAYRLGKKVYQRDMTVCIVNNPALLEGQMQGINYNIEKCTIKLYDLQQSLLKGKNGQLKMGKKLTI